MKYPYLFLCGLLLLSSAGKAQTMYPSGVTNCIARWDFTSTGIFSSLSDASGNGNNGATSNLGATTDFRGTANAAGSFTTTGSGSSYVAVTNNAMLSPSAISIVALVKPTSFTTSGCQYNTILVKGADYNVTGCYGMSIFDNDHDCLNLGINTEELDFIGPTASGPFITPPINQNNWYLMVTTYSGTQLKRYLVQMDPNTYNANITPATQDPVTTALGTNNNDIRIGENQNASPIYSYPFTGSIDEIALFNKELTDKDVQSVYNYLWGGVMVKQPFTDTFLCPNAQFNLNYTVFNSSAFTAGNNFTAELSDASGSFAFPTILGNVSSTASGVIPCTMPNVSLGGTYRIRIKGTNPMYTSPDNGKDIVFGHAPITATIAANPGNMVANNVPVTFTASPSNHGTSVSYIWMRNGVAISGATTVTYTGTSGADFKSGDTISSMVIVTDNNCVYTDTAATNKIGMVVGLNVANVINANNIKVYPNPNRGSFSITGQAIDNKPLDVEILNAVGQSVYHNVWSPVSNKINENVTLENAPAGVYILRARSVTGMSTIRFTISK